MSRCAREKKQSRKRQMHVSVDLLVHKTNRDEFLGLGLDCLVSVFGMLSTRFWQWACLRKVCKKWYEASKTVRWLSLFQVAPQNINLQGLSTLVAMRHLNFANNCWRVFTDQWLESVLSLTSLVSLNLYGCDELTDIGLLTIASLTTLQELDVGACYMITDEGLNALYPLALLRKLSLPKCRKISDGGIRVVRFFRQLVFLSVSFCSMLTDQSCVVFRGLPSLEHLDMIGCVVIGDNGVAVLSRIPTLKFLNVSFSCVTEAGLKALSSLANLQIETQTRVGFACSQ